MDEQVKIVTLWNVEDPKAELAKWLKKNPGCTVVDKRIDKQNKVLEIHYQRSK